MQALNIDFWKLQDGDCLWFEGEPVTFTRPNRFTVDVEVCGVIERFHDPITCQHWLSNLFNAPDLSIQVNA